MILDEPTSVLTPDEADSVLGMVRDMAHRGEISVLMITHKFREVTGFCDEVTVLRKGRFAGSGKVSELTTAQMAEMMVGAEPPSASVSRDESKPKGDRARGADVGGRRRHRAARVERDQLRCPRR